MFLRFLILNILITITCNAFSNSINFEEQYLKYKSKGNYSKAIDLLADITADLEDPKLIEINIFRIYELLNFPELYPKGIEVLKKLKENKSIKANPHIKTRIDIFLNELLLSNGNLNAAKKLHKDIGFLDFYLTGPFNNSSIDHFEKHYTPEKKFNKSEIYKGKTYNVSWIKTKTDHSGIIDFSNLFQEVKDSFFYIHREIKIEQDDDYFIILGKTGYTDIWVDYKPVYLNRKRHNFQQDQYFIKIHLAKGCHKILVKTGDSESGIKFSMRIAKSNFNPLKQEKILYDEPDTSPGQLISSSVFPLLSSLQKQKDKNFITGYIYYISQLNSEENNEVIKYLSIINRESALYPTACYYMGQSAIIQEHKDNYFWNSFNSDPGNIESASELIWNMLGNKFFYEAYNLIKKIKTINSTTPYYYWLQGEFFYLRGWYFESKKNAQILSKSVYPSIGYILNAKINKSEKNYKQTSLNLKKLFLLDQYNSSYIDSLLNNYQTASMDNNAIGILYNAITIYPNSVKYRLMLAKLLSKHDNKKAIPYIASAQKISPYNKEILFQLGNINHKLNNKKLTEYYFNLALKYDPDNFSLKTRLKTITNKRNEIEKFLYKKDISDLLKISEQFKKESAIILLNENAIRVNRDGSYEKTIRNVYKINKKNAINEFNSYSIINNPLSEKIENIRCILIKNDKKIEITQKYKRSLSNPESRLYYNLESTIIPISALSEGCILDISYTIKNWSGNEYKNYFGEKIVIGDNYRTLISNCIISYPEGKNIYCHLKGINKNLLVSERVNEKNIYRILIKNSLPYRKEVSMPHYSEIHPAVYFTSFKTWKDLHSWYKSLLQNKVKMNKDMKLALDKIINKNDNKYDIVKKIYNHVTDEIRYVGFEFGIGGIQPRSSDLTYNSKMGDCKDVSLVLVAMLRYAGIDSSLALLRTRDKGDANLSIPFIGEFNHAICFVNTDKSFFVDGTADYTGFKEIPADNLNISALVINEKKYKFINTKSDIYHTNYVEVNNEINISTDGNSVIKRSLLKKGNSAPSVRYNFKNQQMELYTLNEYWNKRFPGSKIEDLEIKSSSTDKPVFYQYSIKIPALAQTTEKEIIFNSFLVMTDYYQSYALTKIREKPLVLPYKIKTKIFTKFIIPEGYTLYHIPKDEKFINKKFSSFFKYSLNKNAIEISSIIEIKDIRINTDEYNKFREFTRFITRKEMEKIILIKKN